MNVVALAAPAVPRLPRRRDCSREDTQRTERELLVRYHRHGDLAAREELARRFLPLARDLALRYTYTDEPFDDLLQVASLGLIKAIDRFEPERGTKFSSYAAPTILGELKRYFRDKGWALHVPRDLQERTLAVNRETDDEAAELVDLLGAEDHTYELVESRDAIASTWRALPEIERTVLELRFLHDLTQREIGERIGYSQMHVSRLLRRALKRLETAAAAA
jgi:RNA polymerase sigma-B factor